jgi:hypothetical protein
MHYPTYLCDSSQWIMKKFRIMTIRQSQNITHGPWQNPISLISQYSQSFSKTW